MSFVGEATGVFGLLGKAWNLLPAGLKLPNAAFSTAGEPRAATEAVGHGAQRGVLKVVSLNRGIR